MYMIEGKEGKGIRYLAPRRFTGEPFEVTVRDWAVYEKRLPAFFFLDSGFCLLAMLADWLEPSARALGMSMLAGAVQVLHLALKIGGSKGSLRITMNESSKVSPVPMSVSGEHCTFVASIGILVLAIDKQLGFGDWETLVIAISELIVLVGAIPLLRSMGLSWRKQS